MLNELPLFFLVAAGAAFGLVVGSFANVVIYRVPHDQSIVFPASRCPKCGAAIAPWQNIPVLSWLFLRGRCAACSSPISWRYPVVEAVHGVGFGAVILHFGLDFFTPFLLLFFFALVVLALIDWDHKVLPDVITLPWIVIGLLGSFVPGSLVGFKEAAITAAAGYLVFWAIAKSYESLRGIEGLGEGDWKLAAMMGTFLGAQGLLLVVFLASLSGMTYGLVQVIRMRLQGEAEVDELTPVAATAGVAADVTEAVPSVAVVDASLEQEVSAGFPDAAAAAAAAAPEADPPSLGLYKLPFGSFLAGAAIFVLFFGDPVLIWYRSQFNG